MIKEQSKPVVNPAYEEELFEDEILLYSKETTQAVYLNQAAHTVWLLCQANMTVDEIISYLETSYPDQKEQIKGDVLAALGMLQENNVIEFSND